MTGSLKEYADLYRLPGPWCTAYVDAGTGTVDTLEAGDAWPGNARTRLEPQGAAAADLEALEQALQPEPGVPAPVARFVLVHQGKTEINEVLPGERVLPERLSVDPVPDLLPLVKHRPEEFPYIVAEVSREHGEIRLYRAGAGAPESTQEVQGETGHVSKFQGGGWAHLRFQHHTEDVWRRNADEVAGEIDRLVADSGARLVVLAGDVRARGLVQEQLAKATQPLVSVVDSHTHTGGADDSLLNDQVNQRVAEVWAAEQQEIMDRLAMQEGQANPESTTGVGAVVHALQQAQVEVLIFNDQALSERTLLALDAEPWIATAEEESLAANVLGKVPAPAALLRAAALTDARVLLVPGPVLPEGVDVAALLRWSTGPAAPASS
ncbi:Vms1/Ankzf1 family peptidyl-tRNA hydrolase [Pseudarthrobacter sp. NS4]|uniref:baeRF2 domain-containing protein n=1 Tax=Pseudarthrobacter sp. NS4 TaxID=2973976 RepID=UPI0021611F83|nr:Vms1/Ankzf1 family peptidyl-tRNA hydrolase [Pseudarthrobacter sp. NS4]